MKEVCGKCNTDLADPTSPLYTICSGCGELVKLTEPEKALRTSNGDPPAANEIEVTFRRGKIHTFQNVEKALNKHRDRIRRIERWQEQIEQQLQQIERLVRITLSWQCPECGESLSLTETGLLHCADCDVSYPSNPHLGDE